MKKKHNVHFKQSISHKEVIREVKKNSHYLTGDLEEGYENVITFASQILCNKRTLKLVLRNQICKP